MKSKGILITLIIISVALILPSAVKRTERKFSVTSEGKLELENINGNVELNTHKNPEIRIMMEKLANKKNELEEVDVQFNSQENGLKVRVRRHRSGTHTRVHFRIWIPAQLAVVQIKTVNGSLKSTGEMGDLLLESVNGGIRHKGGFHKGRFRSVNGGIEVVQYSVLKDGIDARTVNGSIHLEIRKNSSFRLDAKSMNGSLRNDFDVSVGRHLVGRFMRGAVGSGDISLRLRSINGSIKVLAI